MAIKLHTNFGVITLELDHDKAPVTAANFEQYVKDGFYNGVIFHRVIPGFMIQGGGMTEDMHEKDTRDSIQNEAGNGLGNEKYTIAMARTSDPHSASAQFFINTNDNAFLNHRAKELHGRHVVQRISQVRTTSRLIHQNVPVQPVLIKNVRVGQ